MCIQSRGAAAPHPRCAWVASILYIIICYNKCIYKNYYVCNSMFV